VPQNAFNFLSENAPNFVPENVALGNAGNVVPNAGQV